MTRTSTANGTTTLADLMAAAALGGLDPSTPVVLASDVPSVAQSAADLGATVLPADRHVCGIAGCQHGSHRTDGISQPDRQVKLQCPVCGAVARMTAKALASALGITCHRDGAAFVPAARRTYVRKSQDGAK